nr:ArsC/Spx/MgsR family protein [Burkholderia glumae]
MRSCSATRSCICAIAPSHYRSKESRHEQHHDLSQPGLRHVAQRADPDPQQRRGTGCHRISQNATVEETLVKLLADAGMTVRDVLREKGTPYAELGLADPKWTDEQLLDFIGQHPILINRPIVVTPIGTKLCRPSEAVLDILPNPQTGPFTKEDGEIVIDAEGKRV